LPFRKLNTAKYFRSLSRYGNKLISNLPIRERTSPEIFLGLWDTASHFWCRALRRAGIRYSLHAYGAELVASLYGRLPSWRNEGIANAKQIVACSRGTAALVHSRFGQVARVSVVNPGIHLRLDRERSKVRAEQLRSELRLPGDNILLTLGRLVPRKGVELVLRSLPELIVRFPGLHYVVAGDGPYKTELQKLTADLGLLGRVRFTSHADEPTKWGLYEMCDIFVMPNRLMGGTEWEGFGIVFLEAALFGKPVVGGNNGGVPDAIIDGVTGLLVNPEDQRLLSAALGRLLADHELRRNMGRAAEERVRANFSWELVALEFCRQQGWSLDAPGQTHSCMVPETEAP
jgi:phosphatidyl-myo-inositol dimannoside synthase